jgi:ribosome-associated protein
MKSKKNQALEVAKLCCRALDEKKAGDLRVLDVSEQSSITDYLVLATGTSEPHLRALRVELEKALDGAKAHIVGMETEPQSGWTVVDAFDVMIHLFSEDKRDHYGLENLWKDAVEVPIAKLLGASPRPVVSNVKRRKPPVQAGNSKRKTTSKKAG